MSNPQRFGWKAFILPLCHNRGFISVVDFRQKRKSPNLILPNKFGLRGSFGVALQGDVAALGRERLLFERILGEGGTEGQDSQLAGRVASVQLVVGHALVHALVASLTDL